MDRYASKVYGVVVTDVHTTKGFNKHSESVLMEVNINNATFEEAVNRAEHLSRTYGSHTLVVEARPTNVEFFRGSQIHKEKDGKNE